MGKSEGAQGPLEFRIHFLTTHSQQNWLIESQIRSWNVKQVQIEGPSRTQFWKTQNSVKNCIYTTGRMRMTRGVAEIYSSTYLSFIESSTPQRVKGLFSIDPQWRTLESPSELHIIHRINSRLRFKLWGIYASTWTLIDGLLTEKQAIERASRLLKLPTAEAQLQIQKVITQFKSLGLLQSSSDFRRELYEFNSPQNFLTSLKKGEPHNNFQTQWRIFLGEENIYTPEIRFLGPVTLKTYREGSKFFDRAVGTSRRIYKAGPIAHVF